MELKPISLTIVGVDIAILRAKEAGVVLGLNSIRGPNNSNILSVQVLLILIRRLNAFILKVQQLKVEEHQGLMIAPRLISVEHGYKWTFIPHVYDWLKMNLVIVEHLFLL